MIVVSAGIPAPSVGLEAVDTLELAVLMLQSATPSSAWGSLVKL